MSTFDALCKILVRDYALNDHTLTPETTLASLAIDSLGVIELIFAIEDAFGVTVPDNDPGMARDFGTLAELGGYIDRLIAARDAPGATAPNSSDAGAALPAPP
jgi:acyl carrier protein